MSPGKIIPASSTSICEIPDNLVPEVPSAKYSVHHHLQIVGRMPVTMEVNRACVLQHSATLSKPPSHPVYVDIDSTLPPILEDSHLCTVPPDYLIVAVAEERRVEIDQVDALVGEELGENLKIVPAV